MYNELIFIHSNQKISFSYNLLTKQSNFLPFLLNALSNIFFVDRVATHKYVNKNYNNRFISNYPIDKLHVWPTPYFIYLVTKIKLLQITQYNR